MILVTGASGHLATAILEYLTGACASAAGATRNPSSSQFRALDFDVPETISFEGVKTLVLVSAGTEEDDVVITRHNNVITAAERDGCSTSCFRKRPDVSPNSIGAPACPCLQSNAGTANNNRRI